MENVTIKINGMAVSAPAGSTILEAGPADIEIPTLCFLKDINEIGACRVCVVEVKGARSLVASCVYPINEGMEVFKNTPKVLESRKRLYSFFYCQTINVSVWPALEAEIVSCSSLPKSLA